MDSLKIPVALVVAMAVQLAGVVWYASEMVHDIEHLTETLNKQQKTIDVLNNDVNDLWTFCTFTENKWAEAYVGDMVYERVCGTKEVVGD